MDKLIYYLTHPIPFEVWLPVLIVAALIFGYIFSRPTSVAPDLRHAPDEQGNYSKKSNSSNGASR